MSKPIKKAHRNSRSSVISNSLVIILVLYNLFFIVYGLQKHAAFQTAGFDLGIWDQKVWVALHARPFVITTQAEVEHSLGDHVDPVVLFLILPIYSLFPSPKTLIVFQSVFVSLGALPIYWLAKQRLHSEGAGLVFAVVYLLFPALGGAVTFDLHGITIAAPLLAYALWALYRQVYPVFGVMAVLAMGCQEDVPLLILMMGLYILIFQRHWRMGLLTIMVSLTWFVIVNFWIIPGYGLADDNFHVTRYEALGDSTLEVIITIVTRPDLVIQHIFADDKKLYWIWLTMPTAFVALLDPITLLMALPALFINTLSNYPPTYQLDRFHSSAPIVPFVVVAGINGLARLVRFAAPKFRHVKKPFLQNALLAMILMVTLVYQIQFGHTPIGRNFEWPEVTDHHRQAEAMLAQIPSDAAVAAQNNLVPRLSQREWIFILPKLSQQGRPADYIALDMQSPLYPYEYVDSYCADIAKFLTNPEYGLIEANDGLLLFKRNAPDSATFTPMPPCR